jgi:hypothetical protein
LLPTPLATDPRCYRPPLLPTPVVRITTFNTTMSGERLDQLSLRPGLWSGSRSGCSDNVERVRERRAKFDQYCHRKGPCPADSGPAVHQHRFPADQPVSDLVNDPTKRREVRRSEVGDRCPVRVRAVA